MGELIAIASGKGGTGKTSVCAGLATALAQSGCRVLCVDCDIGLRNLDISLGMTEGSALSFLDVCQGNYSLDDAPRHELYPTLAFLTAPMNCSPGRIDRDAFSAFLRQARICFDFIFLDAPAGLDAGFQLVSGAAEEFLLVTGPGPAAIRDAARVGELLELAGKTRVRLIVNRVEKEMLSALRMTVDDVMDSAGLPLAGIVPEDPNMTLAAAFGRPLLSYKPHCPAAAAFRRIAGRLQGFHRPIPLK